MPVPKQAYAFVQVRAEASHYLCLGESMPVPKQALPMHHVDFDLDKHKKYTCFAGTEVKPGNEGDQVVRSHLTAIFPFCPSMSFLVLFSFTINLVSI